MTLSLGMHDEEIEIESVSISSDCTNTWGLASKLSVMDAITAHGDDDGTHEAVVEKTMDDISRFIAASGVPHMTAVFDGYGNSVHYDGTVVRGSEASYVVDALSSDAVRSIVDYDDASADISKRYGDVIANLRTRENSLVAGDNITISGHVISASVSTYELPFATDSVLGGVTVSDSISPSISSTSSTFVGSAICSALELKQRKLVSSDGSVTFVGKSVFASINPIPSDDFTVANYAVSGGDVHGRVNGLSDALSFGRGLRSTPLQYGGVSLGVVNSGAVDSSCSEAVSAGMVFDELSNGMGITIMNDCILSGTLYDGLSAYPSVSSQNVIDLSSNTLTADTKLTMVIPRGEMMCGFLCDFSMTVLPPSASENGAKINTELKLPFGTSVWGDSSPVSGICSPIQPLPDKCEFFYFNALDSSHYAATRDTLSHVQQ